MENTDFIGACRNNKIDEIKYFLNQGINILEVLEYDEGNPYTTLDICKEEENYEVIKILLLHTVNNKDYKSFCPLYYAVSLSATGDILYDIVKTLVDSGEDINGCAESPPFLKVVSGGYFKTYHFFIESDVDVNSSCRQYTALTQSLMSRRLDMTEHLLDNGADPDFKYSPPFYVPCNSSFREKIQYMEPGYRRERIKNKLQEIDRMNIKSAKK